MHKVSLVHANCLNCRHMIQYCKIFIYVRIRTFPFPSDSVYESVAYDPVSESKTNQSRDHVARGSNNLVFTGS